MNKKIGAYRYFLDQKLGKGAHATVYKGISDINKQPVAVKVI
jgi:hypothetical protein